MDVNAYLTQNANPNFPTSGGPASNGGGYTYQPTSIVPYAPNSNQAAALDPAYAAAAAQQAIIDANNQSAQGDYTYGQQAYAAAAQAAAAKAAADKAAADEAFRNGIYDQKNNYIAGVNEKVDQNATRYGNSVTDYLDTMRTGQANLNTKGAKNELAKMQGVQGITGMVGRGINSAGVMLAGKNAGNSSAAQQIANAYGQLGQRQMSNVGNQYELGKTDLLNEQNTFNAAQGKTRRDMELTKQEFITSVVNEVNDKISALNAQLADASLPERIAIDQEKTNVRNRATSALSQYDNKLATEAPTITANDENQRRAMANDLMSKGTDLGAGAFQYQTEAPMQFQGQQGPAGSNLPLYTLPRRRQGE